MGMALDGDHTLIFSDKMDPQPSNVHSFASAKGQHAYVHSLNNNIVICVYYCSLFEYIVNI